MTDGSGTTTYAYDNADRLTSVTPPGQSAVSYTWDNNGNLTNRGNDTFSWDYENRMTSTTIGGTTTSFAYRGDGLRNSRTTGGNTTTFTWDINAGPPVVIDDGTQYVYGAGLVSQISGSNTYYYLADGLGSTMKTVDTSGNVVNSYDYDVYGKVKTSSGPGGNEFQFAGQEVDGSTGLQYLRARYYDMDTGRFLSREPLATNPEWLAQPFAYADGRPSSLIDPTGLEPIMDIDVVPDGLNPCNWGFVAGRMCGEAEKIADQLATGWALVGEYFRTATDIQTYRHALYELTVWSLRCAEHFIECGFALKNVVTAVALYTFAAGIVSVACTGGIVATGPGGVLLCGEAIVAAAAAFGAATLILTEVSPEELRDVGRREEH